MSTEEWLNPQELRSIGDPDSGYLQRKQPKNGWTTIGGDCPVLRDYLRNKEGVGWEIFKFFIAIARGFAQTVFANNPITGIVLMIALGCISPVTLGVCSAAGFLGYSISILLKEPAVNVDNGLTVFNPLIFGEVSYYFVPKIYGSFDGFSMLMILLGLIFIAYLWRACGNGCIPCLTMPFNLTELILLFTLKNAKSQLLDSKSELLARSLFKINNGTGVIMAAAAAASTVGAPESGFVENTTAAVVGTDLDWGMVVRASVVSASQLFVLDSVPMGAIVYLSLLIYSPITCCFGYTGALLGSLVGLQVGATHESVYSGLWGLNGYLTGASLGGSLLVLNGQGAVATFVAIILTALLQHVLTILFLPTGLPFGTIPFVLATWLFIGLGKSSGETFFYPTTVSFPEAQREELLSSQRSVDAKVAGEKKIQEEDEPEVLVIDGKESVT